MGITQKGAQEMPRIKLNSDGDYEVYVDYGGDILIGIFRTSFPLQTSHEAILANIVQAAFQQGICFEANKRSTSS